MAHSISGILSVELRVVKAQFLGLKGNNKLNPYVVLRLGNQVFKTRVLKRSINPLWNEEFSFSLSEANPQLLKVELFDKRGLLCRDVRMGKSEVDLHHFVSVWRLKRFMKGTRPVRRVVPSDDNFLAGDSCITFCNGHIIQEVCLKFPNCCFAELNFQIKA